ncbi:hypothetical protein FDP41_008845 [Naegleria fowleri]|uniref:UvrD-like helicase C-terminal domain-containing protein n=1 Tax=Naegleria fowleri TaxID=5763 RepID=A0A6A5BD31_NAEFO|nr:uncharacterized protein FDP41_008845 [Naegleria fowleri]KAF0972596.1 hypothetical protein FDP41_008845 [Naegleria fowleri]
MLGEGEKEYTEKEQDLLYITEHFKPYMKGIGEKTVKDFLSKTETKQKKRQDRLLHFVDTLKTLLRNLRSTHKEPISIPALCDYLLQNFLDVKKSADEEYIRRRFSAYSNELASLHALRDIDATVTSDVDQTHVMMTEGVVLSTIHAAKGLEYDYVFIPEVQDGVMPLQKKVIDLSKVPEKQIEKIDESEERRIFYVTMTRAKRCLYFTHVEPSQFISCIFTHKSLKQL